MQLMIFCKYICVHDFGLSTNPILLETHSKKYHKYITNISQIYHKYTTKVLQNVILYHKNVILYHKTECFTTKCNILPHSVVFFKNNPTTNCSILLQNIVIYH